VGAPQVRAHEPEHVLPALERGDDLEGLRQLPAPVALEQRDHAAVGLDDPLRQGVVLDVVVHGVGAGLLLRDLLHDHVGERPARAGLGRHERVDERGLRRAQRLGPDVEGRLVDVVALVAVEVVVLVVVVAHLLDVEGHARRARGQIVGLAPRLLAALGLGHLLDARRLLLVEVLVAARAGPLLRRARRARLDDAAGLGEVLAERHLEVRALVALVAGALELVAALVLAHGGFGGAASGTSFGRIAERGSNEFLKRRPSGSSCPWRAATRPSTRGGKKFWARATAAARRPAPSTSTTAASTAAPSSTPRRRCTAT
jgi:hypothetical protein